MTSFHPSFEPIAARIRERGMYSPYAYVEHEVDGHNHILAVGDLVAENALRQGGSIEEMAEELVDTIDDCKDRSHKKAMEHRVNPADVYKSAVHQLMTREYDREWAHQEWLQAMFKKWGGNIPAGVILPSESGTDWSLLVPNQHGDPVKYDIARDLINLPEPREMGAEKNPIYGWDARRNWSFKRRWNWADRRRNGRH